MNVILITLDACRLDHLSFAGYFRNTSPNLDKISEDGILFMNNYAVIPQSDPAIVSILTGTYPQNHGVRSLGASKIISVAMLQEILKEQNYKTVCMSIEQQSNNSIKKGFDEFNLLSWRVKSKLNRILEKIFKPDKIFGVSGIVTDNAIEWIKKNKGNKFFLYLHYMELHWPYTPPPPFDNIFDPDYKGSHSFIDLSNGKIKRGDMAYNNTLPEEERKHAIAHYDGGIVYMDSQLSNLINFLKDSKLWDSSIVVIVGDHGEHLGEHDFYYQHVASVYQPSIRVPLFIRIPHMKGKKEYALTQTIDIMPTILEALNINIKNDIDGKSLMPLMKGKERKIREYAFAESGISLFKQNKRKYIEGVEGKWRMVTDGKWKLILIPHPNNNIFELYDIENDPLETKNLIRDKIDMVDKLKQKLFVWMENKRAEEKYEEPYSIEGEKKVRERLKRLGYID